MPRMDQFGAAPGEATKNANARAAPTASITKRGRTQRIHTTASLTPSTNSSVHPVKSGAGFVPRYIRTI